MAILPNKTGSEIPNRSLARPEPDLWFQPLDLMQRFSDDVNRLMEAMGGPMLRTPFPTLARRFGEMLPAELPRLPVIDVFRRGEDLLITAELAGIKPEDVTIEIEGNDLLIQGKTRIETKKEETDYWYQERRMGSVYRRIPLPVDTIPENVTAAFHDGILEVTIPGVMKETTPARRRIMIGETAAPKPREAMPTPITPAVEAPAPVAQ